MNIKPIIKPEVSESFFYGDITEWDFRDTVTPAKGKFCYRFTLTFSSGKKVSMQKGGFNSKKEASRAREFTISQLHNQSFVPFKYTAKEFYDYWLYYYLLDEEQITYNTYMSYRNIIYNYLIPKWKNKYLDELGRKEIVSALKGIESESVLKHACSVTMTSFEFARKNHIIQNNASVSAVRDVKKSRKKREVPGQQPQDGRILTIDQISYLLYSCKHKERDIFIPLLLALTTGARVSEVVGMKYGDIDYKKREIYVSRQLGRSTTNAGIDNETLTIQELVPKTGNGTRTIPLAPFVLDEIIMQRKKYELLRDSNTDFYDGDYIWCHDNGIPYSRHSVPKPFKKLLRECNIEPMKWHGLRTTYATVLKNNEVNLKAISVYLGHHSPIFTDDTYIVELQKPVYDCSGMLSGFAKDVLPSKEKEVVDATIKTSFIHEIFPLNPK